MVRIRRVAQEAYVCVAYCFNILLAVVIQYLMTSIILYGQVRNFMKVAATSGRKHVRGLLIVSHIF
jgi:hypothetical protein